MRHLPSHLKTVFLVFLPCVVIASAAFTRAPFRTASDTVTLPIRVMQPDGNVVSVTVNASSGSYAQTLYLKTHRISYRYYEGFTKDKASIRLNGGPWVDLNDDVVECVGGPGFESGRWFGSRSNDCLKTPLHTLQIEIDLADLGTPVNGANTIDFRFNYAFPEDSPHDIGARSSAYRILGMELRDGGGSELIDGTTFTWEDPATWGPPEGYDNPSDISAGEALWSERNILSGFHHVGDIRASCADCHAEDGRDLLYFAYSNESIINRSEFHNLTTEQGKQIAAYIRSYELYDPDDGHRYDPPARPWTPVYQPGPSSVASRSEGGPRSTGTAIHDMPSGGSQYWAAGAGYDWVLERTQDGLAYLFPNGITNEAFEVDRTKNPELKMWDIPIALLYPDWNEWLPHHHPMDIFGDDWENTRLGNRDYLPWEIYYDSNYDGGYHSFESCWESSGGSASQCASDAATYLSRLMNNARFWSRAHYGSMVESNANNISTHSEHGARSENVHKWTAVKAWETIHRRDLSDEYHHVIDNPSPLQWPVRNGRTPFDIAPHIVGNYAGGSGNDRTEWDLYLNTAWYDLHTNISHGKGYGIGIKPNDWKYQMQFIPRGGNVVQYMKSQMKVQEVCDSFDGRSSPSDVPAAWLQRTSHCDFGTRYIWKTNGLEALESYRSGISGQILEAAFRSQVETMMYKYSPDLDDNVDVNWERHNSERGWDPQDVLPSYNDRWWKGKATGSRYLKSLAYMKDMGVKPSLLDSAAHWLGAMSPSDLWDDYKCTENGGPLDCSKPSLLGGDGDDEDVSVSLNIPAGSAFLQAPASIVLHAEVSSPNDIEQVTFYADDAALGSRAINYEYVWTHVPAGTHTLHVEATTTTGATRSSAPVSVTIDEGTPTSPSTTTQSIQLEPGWNMVSTHLAPAPSAINMIFEDAQGDILLVKDEAGALYTPSENVDGIGHWNPFEAYMVRVDRALTVTIEGKPLGPTHTPIQLQKGWNLVTFLPEAEQPVEEALASISGALTIAKDERGNTYIPAYGVNTIGMLTPGQGYQLYVSESTELIYPDALASPSTASLQGE